MTLLYSYSSDQKTIFNDHLFSWHLYRWGCSKLLCSSSEEYITRSSICIFSIKFMVLLPQYFPPALPFKISYKHFIYPLAKPIMFAPYCSAIKLQTFVSIILLMNRKSLEFLHVRRISHLYKRAKTRQQTFEEWRFLALFTRKDIDFMQF